MRAHLLCLAACLALAAIGCSTEDDGAGGGGSGGSAGIGGTGGTAGSGGSAACEPLQGEPLDVPERTWTWVGIEGNKCRNGSPTGIGVYRNPDSDRLVIYLEGGGACFNQISCNTNPEAFGEANFRSTAFTGILNFGDPANPLAGANFIYVPYCTGDVHAGSAEGANVVHGPTNQSFVGHDNVGRALARIVPTFPDVERVVLTGSSAGGFGAWLNYEQVAKAFCREDVVLLDDAGPPLSAPYLATCLQERWRTLWGLDETLPAGCTDCAAGVEGGGVTALAPYLVDAYPEARFGLISSLRDSTISLFFGFAQDDCAILDNARLPDTEASGDTFEQGLLQLKSDLLDPAPNATSYFLAGSKHTWTRDATLSETNVDGALLVDWITAMVDGPIPDAVTPAPAAD